MQEFKHADVLSRLSLEMRKNAEKLGSLKKGNPHLRHQSSDYNSFPNLTPQLHHRTLLGFFLTLPACTRSSRKPHIVPS